MAASSQVLALLILDADANRLAVKYCVPGLKLFATVDAQKKFEKKVVAKLAKPTGRVNVDADVALIGDHQLVLYKGINDLYVCVVCSVLENEVILSTLLEGLCQALSQATHVSFVNNQVTKQTVLEALDQVLLVLDEAVDDLGIPMEVDEEKIINRVRMLDDEMNAPESQTSEPERVFQQATQAAKKRLIESLLGGRS